MDCRECSRELLDYLDRELPSSLMQAVEEHIAACPACQVELDGYRNVKTMVGLRRVTVPDEAWFESKWQGIRDAIPARVLKMEIAQNAEDADDVRPLWRRKTAILATLAAALLLMLSGLYAHRVLHGDIEEEYASTIMISPAENYRVPAGMLIDTRQQPPFEVSVSRAALGGLDPISKSVVLIRAEDIRR